MVPQNHQDSRRSTPENFAPLSHGRRQSSATENGLTETDLELMWHGTRVPRPTHELVSRRKLCLVLDIDHTLLHSIVASELNVHVYNSLVKMAEVDAQKVHNRSLFFLKDINMFTKLRPGVRELLDKVSQMYELYIYTNGNRAYAEAVVPLLDPMGCYFNNMGRVIAQGANRFPSMASVEPKTLERFKGKEGVTVIVDDNSDIWKPYSSHLVTIEKYHYFPMPELGSVSLLERRLDENVHDGMLSIIGDILEKAHKAVFGTAEVFRERSLPPGKHAPWDVREVIPRLRRKVLQGIHITFSGVIPLDQPPHEHRLWQLAESFGARCSPTFHPEVTHVIARNLGTTKAKEAVSAGLPVVHYRWLYASCLLWSKAREADYQLDR